MAITPRSKGLGNIGSIVNRQGKVSPTRPAPKPAAKLAPKMPVPKPVAPARPNTTTLAQRQANQPFKNYSKPAQPKINPLAQQPNLLQQAMSPQPRPDLPPGAQMRKPMLGATQPTTPPPQPFNPEPNPGQPGMQQNSTGMDFGQFFNQGMQQNPNATLFGPGGLKSQYEQQYGKIMDYSTGQPDPFIGGMNNPVSIGRDPPGPLTTAFGIPGQSPMGEPTLPYMGGQFGGNGYQVGGDPWINPFTGQPSPAQPDSMNMTAPYMDPYGPAGQQPGNFGNPNPLTSDYDELEGSAFNTNPSNGSMFGGGGFTGY